jgi:hypothetical protein
VIHGVADDEKSHLELRSDIVVWSVVQCSSMPGVVDGVAASSHLRRIQPVGSRACRRSKPSSHPPAGMGQEQGRLAALYEAIRGSPPPGGATR